MVKKRLIPIFLLSFVFLYISPSSAEVLGIYFPPGKRAHRPIINLYKNAQKSIHLAIYTLTKNDITRALINAHKRGVEIKVIMDDEKALDIHSDDEKLEEAGIGVVKDGPLSLMHNKFAIIDGIIVYTGSYNHTRSGTEYNDENYIIIKDKEVAEVYERQFQKLWEKYKR